MEKLSKWGKKRKKCGVKKRNNRTMDAESLAVMISVLPSKYEHGKSCVASSTVLVL